MHLIQNVGSVTLELSTEIISHENRDDSYSRLGCPIAIQIPTICLIFVPFPCDSHAISIPSVTCNVHPIPC